MEMRTATGKILLALTGTVGAALVVFVVAPWLQSPPPPPSPASPDEIVQEVMGPPGENEGEVTDEADTVAGALPEGEETVPPVLGPVAQPVEESGEDQEVVGVLPAPLTPDEVASAMLAQSVPDEEDGDEAAVGEAVEAAVNQFAAAVLEKLDEMVDTAAPPPDAVVMASAPSVDEDEEEAAGPEPEPADAATAVETERQAAAQVPAPEGVEHAPPVEPVVIERDMRIEFSMPVVEVSAAATGPPSGAPVPPEVPAPPLGPLETPAHEAAQRPSVLPAAGLAEWRWAEAVTAPHVPRGVMGYRMPLVSRQELPIQVVSGVVMPAHHTYVILRPGYWELLMEGGETMVPAEPVVEEQKPVPRRRRWNPLDLFRKRTPAGEE